MTTVVTRKKPTWRSRPDGIPEVIRPSLASVLTAELVTLASLAGGAALVGASFSRGLAALLAAAVLAAWLVAASRRREGPVLRFGEGADADAARSDRRAPTHRPDRVLSLPGAWTPADV